MMWPSMTCVKTWGLTTALGVGVTVGSVSGVGGTGAGNLGAMTGGPELGPLMLGGPRLGIGGLTSLVSIGGPLSVGLVVACKGATVEVGRVVESWYKGFTGMEGIVTTIDCPEEGVEVRGGPGLGIIIGVKVGGPWLSPAMVVITSFCKVGGLGPTLFKTSLTWVKGDPGILGTILGVAMDLGPGGLPGPMLVPLGDIFCLDFGLGWLGRLGPGVLNPILGPVWVTAGRRGAIDLKIE